MTYECMEAFENNNIFISFSDVLQKSIDPKTNERRKNKNWKKYPENLH